MLKKNTVVYILINFLLSLIDKINNMLNMCIKYAKIKKLGVGYKKKLKKKSFREDNLLWMVFTSNKKTKYLLQIFYTLNYFYYS